VQGNPEAGDRFGAALSAERITDDAFFDLVVGAPGENVGGIVDAGAANVFYGGEDTVPSVSSQTLLQDNVEAGDQLGAAMTVGYFSDPSQSFVDLAVGAPGGERGRHRGYWGGQRLLPHHPWWDAARHQRPDPAARQLRDRRPVRGGNAALTALLHLVVPRHAEGATTCFVQIARARSSNATATRRLAGSSTATS
jgi:hypothetical protein